MARRSFGLAAQQDPQLDLFAPKPDFVIEETTPSRLTGGRNWRARWKGEYAGSIHEIDGKLEPVASLGWALYSNGASSHQHWLGACDTIEQATEALEKRTLEARADDTLIWTLKRTKENIRKAKAKGWWKRDEEAA